MTETTVFKNQKTLTDPHPRSVNVFRVAADTRRTLISNHFATVTIANRETQVTHKFC